MIIYFLFIGKHPFYYLRKKFENKNEREKYKYYNYIHNKLFRPRIPEDYEFVLSRETALMREC